LAPGDTPTVFPPIVATFILSIIYFLGC